MRPLNIAKQITNRGESPALQKYLEEIAEYPKKDIEEEVELFNMLNLLNPDNKELPKELKNFDLKTKKAIEKVVDDITKANLRFVVSVAKQYQQQNIELLDLINEGNIGLVKAIYRFDYTKGFKFISYAVWRIRQSILQHLQESKFIRYPANRGVYVNRINKFIRRFQQINLRLPEEKEVCEGCDITQEDYERYLAVTCSKKISLDSKINPDEDDSKTIGETATMSQYSGISSPDSRVTEQTEINRLLELRLHSDNEMLYKYAFVCVLKFGLNPGGINPDGIGIERTDEEIVEKFLKRGLFIKTESVRTLFDRAKKKLATILTPDGEIREEYKVYMEKLKANNPISDIFIKYSKEKITQAVEQLSEKKGTETQAKVFSLKYGICSKFNPDGKKYTIKEIAGQLKRREGSARTTLDIAIKNLNNILSQPEITPKPGTRLNTNNPTSDILLKYSKEKIIQALEQLSKTPQTRSQAKVFSLKYGIPNNDLNPRGERYDIKDIAGMLGRSKGSVQHTLDLAIKNLNDILSQPEIIPEPLSNIPDSNISEPLSSISDNKVYAEQRDASDVNYRRPQIEKALMILENKIKKTIGLEVFRLYYGINPDGKVYDGHTIAETLVKKPYTTTMHIRKNIEENILNTIEGIDSFKLNQILENLKKSCRTTIIVDKTRDASDVNYRRPQIEKALNLLKQEQESERKKGNQKRDGCEVFNLYYNSVDSDGEAYTAKKIAEELGIPGDSNVIRILKSTIKEIIYKLGIDSFKMNQILKNLKKSCRATIIVDKTRDSSNVIVNKTKDTSNVIDRNDIEEALKQLQEEQKKETRGHRKHDCRKIFNLYYNSVDSNGELYTAKKIAEEEEISSNVYASQILRKTEEEIAKKLGIHLSTLKQILKKLRERNRNTIKEVLEESEETIKDLKQ